MIDRFGNRSTERSNALWTRKAVLEEERSLCSSKWGGGPQKDHNSPIEDAAWHDVLATGEFQWCFDTRTLRSTVFSPVDLAKTPGFRAVVLL